MMPIYYEAKRKFADKIKVEMLEKNGRKIETFCINPGIMAMKKLTQYFSLKKAASKRLTNISYLLQFALVKKI